MKKILLAGIAALSMTVLTEAQELTRVVFTPNWTPQTQYSGFYLAKELGYYKEEGLDVSILHIGSNSSETVAEKLIAGEADFVEQQLMQALISRSDGAKITNVMQVTQHTGMMLVANKTVKGIKDLDGFKIARWRQGYSEMCELLTMSSDINVQWVPTLGGINILLFGAVDAALCYSYSEYIKLYLATGDIPEDNVLRFPELGIDGPEDGIYVTEDYYEKHPDIVEKFVRASKRGWEYARTHRDEAIELSIRYCNANNVQTNWVFQKMQLEEYLKLQTNWETGRTEYSKVEREQFDHLVEILSSCNMIISKPKYEELIK